MTPLTMILLALAFLFVLFIRWASQSIPRAIIFVALLCASPYIAAIALGVLVAASDSEQHQTLRAKR